MTSGSSGARDKRLSAKELEAKFEEFMNESLTTSDEEDEKRRRPPATGDGDGTEQLWWLQEGTTTNKPKATFVKPTRNESPPTEEEGDERKPQLFTGASKREVTISPAAVVTGHAKESRVTSQENSAESAVERATTDDTRSAHELGTYDQSGIDAEFHVNSTTEEGVSGLYSEDFESERLMTNTNNDGHTANDSFSIGRRQDLSLSSEDVRRERPEETDYKGTKEEETSAMVVDILPPSPEMDEITEFKGRSVGEILREAEELEQSLSRSDRSGEDETGKKNAAYGEETERAQTIASVPLDSASTYKVPNSALDQSNLQQLLREERRKNAKLNSNIQRQKIDHEERMFRQQEENMQLKARLEELVEREGETGVVRRKSEAVEEDQRQLERFARQAKEQERLFIGYEKENERLYVELKEVRHKAKLTKEKAEEECRCLRQELVRTRQDLEYKNVILASREDVKVSNETTITRKELDAQKRINEGLVEKLVEMEETEGVPGKVRDLKERIITLEKEVRDKNAENRSLSGIVMTKERKVEQLQKQVKQLESLLQLRNPNSISALVLAAEVADGARRITADGSSRVVCLLEERVRDLESQLVSQTTEGSKSFDTLRHQFNLIKDQYDARVEQLERQLARSASTKSAHQAGSKSSRPQTTITALETELESVRERHRREVAKLKRELDALRRESRRGFKNGDRVAALMARIRTLVAECKAKDKCIDELRREAKTKVDLPNLQQTDDITYPKTVEDMAVELKRLRGELEAVEGVSETKVGAIISNRQSELAEVHSNLKDATSRFLEMRRKCDTQEMIIANLRAQLSDAESLEAENETLRVRCRQLQGEVCRGRAPRDSKPMEFADLQAEMSVGERMYRDKEVNKWKCKFYARNVELEKFRKELNVIIETLEDLQKGFGS